MMKAVAARSFHPSQLPTVHSVARPAFGGQALRLARCRARSPFASDDGASASRREVLQGPPKLVLASTLGWGAVPGAALAGDWYSVPPTADPETIVITGANSGIGFSASRKLARAGHDVHLVCRTMERAVRACDAIRAEDGLRGSVTPHQCDLGSLANIREFAAAWAAGGAAIDVLCLNAGAQFTGVKDPPRTADGFEISVGVNHLGHFLLANLLLPAVEASRLPHPRVVMTASEVHDPVSPGGAVGNGATLGNLQGLKDGPRFTMVTDPADPYDADKAYKDSKLCNVLFARELCRRLAASGSRVTVNAFGPGLITRSGFFRNQDKLFVRLFDFAVNDVFRVAETVEGGGSCLAFMAVDPSLEGQTGKYYNNELDGLLFLGGHAFKAKDPSVEARNADEAALLWQLSAQLVGLQA